MSAETFYNGIDSLEFEATCVGIGQEEWDRLMLNARKADRRKCIRLIKINFPEMYEQAKCRYTEYLKTSTHIIMQWSLIEHFFKIT